MRPHRLQPTRLPCPWDSPGKNTGVGCHFLLQCMTVKSESEVTQSCPMSNSLRPHGLQPTGHLCPWEFPGKSTGVGSHCLLRSVTKLCPTLCNPMDYSMPDFPVLHYLLEFTQTMSIELVMPSNHLILCHPLLLQPSIFPSIRVFSNESVLHIRGSKYWSFSISLSSEYSEFISFKVTGLISLQSKELSRVFSNTTIQKHQFFSTQPSLWSNSHIHT